MLGGGLRRTAPTMAAAAMAVILSGCQLVDDGDNLVAGKQAFVERCGSCHTLSRAGTTGVTGPDLDSAFAQSRADGLGESTFAGVVHGQIKNPARNPQRDPTTGKALPIMPADLVEGETARDVAAYVAAAAAKSGEDSGALARIGVKRSDAVAEEKGGVVDIPADPSGALAYTFGSATATPGKLTLESLNAASIPHNIAIEGNGLDVKGAVVQDGGVSKVEVDVAPGTYTFYCSVPGHRQGGMLGKLEVK